MKDWQLTFSASKPWALPGRAIMVQSMKKGTSEIMAQENELFWELMVSLEKKLFNFLHKALNFSEDSKDLYQEVVIRAWRYFPSFDRQRSFSTWIFAIAHNEIKKYFKKRKAGLPVISLTLLTVEPAAPADDPAVALIYDAARQLPLRQREIFFLFYYNRFSIAEIADICGLRQGNVKFILNCSREAVRRALEASHEI
jgi:RNA polymerase sigma-70 factor (ECF subfamily)